MNKDKSNIFHLFLFIAVFLFVLPSVAQSNTGLTYYKEKYSTDNLIRLHRELNIDIKLENDNILITQTSLDENLFLNESATQYSKESINYSTFLQLEKVEASSYNLENGKYTEYKVSEFRRKDELNNSFYDDVRSVNFIYPNLNSGSKTKLVLKERVMNPRFLSAFYFGGYYPIVNSKLTITVDKNIELDFKEYNIDSINIIFNKKEKKNKIIYSWESKNVDAFDMEDETPNFKNYYPHIIPIITQYKTADNKIINLSSEVSDLYNWYYSLTKNINSNPLDTNLITLVENLVKDKDSELEKVKAIYYWVQNNIKYIAFEYALGGFIPREANDIYQKKFGDCKDNSSILYEMLKAADIKGNLTWIGTRDIPYTYSELPTPAVDNHMILTYQDGKDIYFLDATGRFISLELPTSFIQGKEALIGNEDDGFKIIKVPIVEAKINTEIDTSFLHIHEKSLVGSATKVFTGYKKIDIYHQLEPLNTQKKLKIFYKGKLQKGNNKFNTNNIIEINKFDYDKAFKVNFDFTISDYVVTTSDEIYINLNLDKKGLEFFIKDNRKTDIEINYKNSYSFINELIIPEGFQVDYIPENVNIENKLFSASFTYEQKDKKIIYTHKLKFDFLILNIEDQHEYSDLLKKVEKAYKEIIVLKKNKI